MDFCVLRLWSELLPYYSRVIELQYKTTTYWNLSEDLMKSLQEEDLGRGTSFSVKFYEMLAEQFQETKRPQCISETVWYSLLSDFFFKIDGESQCLALTEGLFLLLEGNSFFFSGDSYTTLKEAVVLHLKRRASFNLGTHLLIRSERKLFCDRLVRVCILLGYTKESATAVVE